jgi:hypothetical protein
VLRRVYHAGWLKACDQMAEHCLFLVCRLTVISGQNIDYGLMGLRERMVQLLVASQPDNQDIGEASRTQR